MFADAQFTQLLDMSPGYYQASTPYQRRESQQLAFSEECMTDFLKQSGLASVIVGSGCVVVATIFMDLELALIGTFNLVIGAASYKIGEVRVRSTDE